MAENKSFNSRIVLKHDVEANWLMAVNFIPKDGEVIIYDADVINPVRIKIGNGIDKVNDLPFYSSVPTQIIETNKSTPISIWMGTSAEYQAITTIDPNTLYYVTDEDTTNLSQAETIEF